MLIFMMVSTYLQRIQNGEAPGEYISIPQERERPYYPCEPQQREQYHRTLHRCSVNKIKIKSE